MLRNYIMFPQLSTIQKKKKYEKFRGPFEHEAWCTPLLKSASEKMGQRDLNFL